MHAVVRRCERKDTRAVRQREGAPVRAVDHLFHAGDRPCPEELDELVARERGAHREPQRHDAGGRRLGAVRAPTELGGRGGEDLADRVVELTDAREPGRERHVGESEVGGLHEHPRGLRPLRPRERERSGTDLGEEQPVDLALAVAEARRDAGDAFAVDHAVGDQAHGPRDGVATGVPLG